MGSLTAPHPAVRMQSDLRRSARFEPRRSRRSRPMRSGRHRRRHGPRSHRRRREPSWVDRSMRRNQRNPPRGCRSLTIDFVGRAPTRPDPDLIAPCGGAGSSFPRRNHWWGRSRRDRPRREGAVIEEAVDRDRLLIKSSNEASDVVSMVPSSRSRYRSTGPATLSYC